MLQRVAIKEMPMQVIYFMKCNLQIVDFIKLCSYKSWSRVRTPFKPKLYLGREAIKFNRIEELACIDHRLCRLIQLHWLWSISCLPVQFTVKSLDSMADMYALSQCLSKLQPITDSYGS